MGIVSGGMVMVSGWFYIVRTWQGKIKPNLVSFGLWTILGFALWVTYKSSGAVWNVLPAVFGFVNPLLIWLIALIRKAKASKLEPAEWICLVCVLISLGMWAVMRHNPALAQYALYVAIVADYCAGIPHWRFVRREPFKDQPLAWIIFAVGFGLAIFAVPERTIANYALPTSSFILGVLMAFPLCKARWQKRILARERA